MSLLHFFTSCNQRNEEEKTKASNQGDRKTIFRERNGYDGSIYWQASSRTGEFKSFGLCCHNLSWVNLPNNYTSPSLTWEQKYDQTNNNNIIIRYAWKIKKILCVIIAGGTVFKWIWVGKHFWCTQHFMDWGMEWYTG